MRKQRHTPDLRVTPKLLSLKQKTKTVRRKPDSLFNPQTCPEEEVRTQVFSFEDFAHVNRDRDLSHANHHTSHHAVPMPPHLHRRTPLCQPMPAPPGVLLLPPHHPPSSRRPAPAPPPPLHLRPAPPRCA